MIEYLKTYPTCGFQMNAHGEVYEYHAPGCVCKDDYDSMSEMDDESREYILDNL